MNSESHWAAKRPIPFTNVSGETIPAFAVMAITGLVYENGIAFLECDKPSTTFRREYAVNNIFDVPADRRGTCFRAGDLRVLYDSGAPGAGEGWGPKPGQWSLSQGFPGFTVQGIVDASHKIAKAFFEPIAQALVKTTSLISPNATTQFYRIYAGTFGSEADAGFTTVPTATNRTGQSMDAGEWAWLAWTNNGWELRCLQNRVYHATYLNADRGPGALGAVNLPDGRSVLYTNWSVDATIKMNDKILVWQDFTDSAWYGIKSGGGGTDRVWYGTAVDNIAPGASGTVTKSDSTTPEATNWSDTVSISTSEKILIWLDSFDNNYYCIKSGGGGTRWFNATLNSPGLLSEDPTGAVTTYEALDGGAHPGLIAAAVNKHKLSGQTGDEVLVVENLAQSNYQIVQVQHVHDEFVTEITYDPVTERILKHKRRDVTVMHEAAETAFENILAAEIYEIVDQVNYDAGTNVLSYNTRFVYTFPDSVAGGTVEIHRMVDVVVASNIQHNTGSHSLTWDARTVAVWEDAAASGGSLQFEAAFPVTDVYQLGAALYKNVQTIYVENASMIPVPLLAVPGTLCADVPPSPDEQEVLVPFFGHAEDSGALVAAISAATNNNF